MRNIILNMQEYNKNKRVITEMSKGTMSGAEVPE
jgi:hypothetical protein